MTIIIAIIAFSIIILIHELGHFLTAKKFGIFVGEFGLGLPPRAWGKKIGETIYSINWFPFGGFVNIAGENGEDETINKLPKNRIFYNLPIWKRMCIIAAGVVMNFLLGWLLLSIVFMSNVAPAVFVAQVQPQSPAAQAGISVNDKLVDFKTSQDFTNFTKNNQGKDVTIRVERYGKEISYNVKLREGDAAKEGALGVMLADGGHEKLGFFASIKEGLIASWRIVEMTFYALKGLITGQISVKNVTGVVGIGKATSEATKLGITYLLQLMALVSINLAVFNILPFPALDGGRLLFLLIEKIKGSPLPQKFEQWANAVGLLLLIGLMILVTGHDIYRFFIK